MDMKKISFLLAVVVCLSLSACAQAPTAAPAASESQTECSEEQLRRDIGEMLLVGFRGTSVDSTHHIVRDIRDYHVGGVILFEYDAPTGTRHRNVSSPAQVKKLCADLQALTSETLLISIDQEGGNVARLRQRDGFPATRTAQATAQEGDKAVRQNARVVSEELQQAGINLNFAPCVDVDVNPACPVIGKMGRSFSADPDVVTRCARIWIEEQRQHGVLSCLKHFPGHGSAKGDTHAGLVDVSATWKDCELDPYRQMIADSGVDMVMVAHVVNSKFGDQLPASLSPNVVNKLLRDSLGFRGVVITDDMAMGAIVRQYGFAEGLRMAIAAGCDMLCLSNNGGGTYDPDLVPKAVEAIVQMVHAGTLSAADIHASAQRIRALKKTLPTP